MNIFLFSIIKNNNMMYQKYVSIILFLLFTESSIGQNTVCFTIEDNPDINSIAYSDFTKYVRVLDCFNIYAESSIPDAKVLHAASIAAELLDNNEDVFVVFEDEELEEMDLEIRDESDEEIFRDDKVTEDEVLTEEEDGC